MRQVLTESLVLATAGGLLGVLAARLGVPALVALIPADVPRLGVVGGGVGAGVTVGWGVLAFGLVAAVVTGVLFGLPPALHAAGAQPGQALRASGRGLGGGRALGRLRQAFVAGQLALALILLAGSGLLVRSLLALHAVDPGFDPRGVLSFRIGLPGQEYDSEEKARPAGPGGAGPAHRRGPRPGPADHGGAHPRPHRARPRDRRPGGEPAAGPPRRPGGPHDRTPGGVGAASPGSLRRVRPAGFGMERDAR